MNEKVMVVRADSASASHRDLFLYPATNLIEHQETGEQAE